MTISDLCDCYFAAVPQSYGTVHSTLSNISMTICTFLAIAGVEHTAITTWAKGKLPPMGGNKLQAVLVHSAESSGSHTYLLVYCTATWKLGWPRSDSLKRGKINFRDYQVIITSTYIFFHLQDNQPGSLLKSRELAAQFQSQCRQAPFIVLFSTGWTSLVRHLTGPEWGDLLD